MNDISKQGKYSGKLSRFYSDKRNTFCSFNFTKLAFGSQEVVSKNRVLERNFERKCYYSINKNKIAFFVHIITRIECKNEFGNFLNFN